MLEASAQAVIVGAGPAGSATAAALAERGVDVLLLDKAEFPREKTCGDGLTPRSVAALQQLGLLADLENNGARRIPGVRIYAPNGRAVEVAFDELADIAIPYGLTVTRQTLDYTLLEHARASGARFVGRFNVSRLLWSDGPTDSAQRQVVGVAGTLAGSPALVRAPLTCLATGASMPLIQQAGLLPRIPPVTRAARSYYEGADGLEPVFQLYFDRAFLPGYGWIFPLSGGRANVGAGYMAAGRLRHRAIPPRRVYDLFVSHNPAARQQLAGAWPVDAVRSYPLRTDFLTMDTQRGGLLLVGEATGLVNPINGEGVDFALESGLMAAEVAAEALLDQDVTAGRLALYGRRLHERYGSFFRYLIKMRDWYIREPMLNLIVGKAERRPHLKHLFVGAALGLTDPRTSISPRTLAQIVF